MKDILNDIREKTEGMESSGQSQLHSDLLLVSYADHFFSTCSDCYFIVHYVTYKKPEFTCVTVNQTDRYTAGQSDDRGICKIQ